MKIGWLEIKIVRNAAPAEPKATLIVTGQCQDSKLKELENHCRENNIKIIATSLPVLGVFSLDGADVKPIDGTKK